MLPLRRIIGTVAFSLLALWTLGCGTTREKLATNQLLLSDAVDRAVAGIDFSPLDGRTVYLDTTYLRSVRGSGFVNADYIISSVRQQMLLAGCLIQDKREEADFIAEARVGALGNDSYDVKYGIPGSQGLTAAASLMGAPGVLPAIPEISFASKTDDTAATKIAVFAYHRESREPVWQSGLSVARSTAQARWVLGAGPFQSGSIYDGTQFAGSKLRSVGRSSKNKDQQNLNSADLAYRGPAVMGKLNEPVRLPDVIAEEQPQDSEVQQTGHEEPAAAQP